MDRHIALNEDFWSRFRGRRSYHIGISRDPENPYSNSYDSYMYDKYESKMNKIDPRHWMMKFHCCIEDIDHKAKSTIGNQLYPCIGTPVYEPTREELIFTVQAMCRA